MSGAFHGLEYSGAGVLKRNVKIRQDFAFGHERNYLVHMRVGIHVMQAHPHAQFSKLARQVCEARFHRTVAPESAAVFQVNTVGAGVLGDYQ